MLWSVSAVGAVVETVSVEGLNMPDSKSLAFFSWIASVDPATGESSWQAGLVFLSGSQVSFDDILFCEKEYME